MPRRLEATHRAFTLTCRLMRVRRAVIEIATLAMFHARENLALSGSVARKLVGDKDAWDVRTTFEELAEERLRCSFVSSALNQNIEDVAILIDRPPQVMSFAVDFQEHLVE